MKNLLFVCLGNICRSPSAEAVMSDMVKKEGLKEVYCDSAGIVGYHEGSPADKRMRTHASKRGYRLTSISRQINDTDFDKFDMIIGMDDQNIQDLYSLAKNNTDRSKVYRMTDFSSAYNYDTVPDPYYGGGKEFELVLDILEDACAGLVKHLRDGN